MENVLFQFHSGLRYLVLLAALVCIVVLAMAARSKRPSGTGAKAWRVYLGLLDLQVLIGLVLVFVRPFFGALMGHITMMALALIAAHAASVIHRRRAPEQRTPVILLAGVLVSLLLIVGGILSIGRPLV